MEDKVSSSDSRGEGHLSVTEVGLYKSEFCRTGSVGKGHFPVPAGGKSESRILPKNSAGRSTACCYKGLEKSQFCPRGTLLITEGKSGNRVLPTGSATAVPVVVRAGYGVFSPECSRQNQAGMVKVFLFGWPDIFLMHWLKKAVCHLEPAYKKMFISINSLYVKDIKYKTKTFKTHLTNHAY